MRKRSRTRRRLKWIGLFAWALFIAAWVVSLPFEVKWQPSDDWRAELRGGCLLVQGMPLRAVDGLWPTVRGAVDAPRWSPGWGRLLYADRRLGNPRPDGAIWGVWCRYVRIPMWCFLVIASIPIVFLWWRDRPIPSGLCQHCGYNLTGNVSGRCPECGTQIAEWQRPSEHGGSSS